MFWYLFSLLDCGRNFTEIDFKNSDLSILNVFIFNKEFYKHFLHLLLSVSFCPMQIHLGNKSYKYIFFYRIKKPIYLCIGGQNCGWSEAVCPQSPALSALPRRRYHNICIKLITDVLWSWPYISHYCAAIFTSTISRGVTAHNGLSQY